MDAYSNFESILLEDFRRYPSLIIHLLKKMDLIKNSQSKLLLPLIIKVFLLLLKVKGTANQEFIVFVDLKIFDYKTFTQLSFYA